MLFFAITEEYRKWFVFDQGVRIVKIWKLFFRTFFVPDDSLFLPDSKTPSFLRNGSVIFEILSFETSLGGWGFPYSSSICIIPICNLFLKLTTTIHSYINSAARGHPKYVIWMQVVFRLSTGKLYVLAMWNIRIDCPGVIWQLYDTHWACHLTAGGVLWSAVRLDHITNLQWGASEMKCMRIPF